MESKKYSRTVNENGKWEIQVHVFGFEYFVLVNHFVSRYIQWL